MELLGTAWTVGWMVVRRRPWMLAGPFGDVDDAFDMAERLGPEFRIGYGERLAHGDNYVPLAEPVDWPCDAVAGEEPGTPRVLWVDRDAPSRWLAEALLDALGGAVFVGAGTAEEGLALAGASSFDLAVVSQEPVGAGGLQLASQIGRIGSVERVVLLAAANTGVADLRLHSVAAAVLTRPLTARDLAHELSFVCRNR